VADSRDWKVFLSSPIRGLREYRSKAREAIDATEGFSVVCQEQFGAMGWSSVEACVRKVRECDVLVGLVGPTYGSVPEGDDRSYSVIEYDTARAKPIQCLMEMLDDAVSLTGAAPDTAQSRAKQAEFRKRVPVECTRDVVRTPDEFARKVVQALHNWERSGRQQDEKAPRKEDSSADFYHPHGNHYRLLSDIQKALAKRGMHAESSNTNDDIGWLKVRVREQIPDGLQEEILRELRAMGHVMAGLSIERLRHRR
jgi:hypothetical protein